jgi:hypothetical protein
MTMGRPIVGQTAKSFRMQIRLEPEEVTAYDLLANEQGLSRSEWMRGVCNEEVRRAKEESERNRMAVDSKQPATQAKRKKSTARKDNFG